LLGASLGLLLGLSLGLSDGAMLRLGAAVPTIGAADGESDGEELGTWDEGSKLGESDGAALGRSDGCVLGDPLGKKLMARLRFPIDVGFDVDGSEEGKLDGYILEVGKSKGLVGVESKALGWSDGAFEGIELGLSLGLSDGVLLGFSLGLSDGKVLGLSDGEVLGLVLGLSEGDILMVGENVPTIGALDGESEGLPLGM